MPAAGAFAAAGADGTFSVPDGVVVPGAVVVVEGVIGAVSKTERFSRPPRIVRVSEVNPKITAKTNVVFVKKFDPPELPKTVLLDPPRVALISAPFPDCIKTTTMIRKQVRR